MALVAEGNPVLDQCVHERYAQQAARTPDAIAVVGPRRTVSYRELSSAADAIARRLVDSGVAPGSLVGVLLERDERLVAAILGVWKAGAAYVPLDPADPAQRFRFIAADTGMRRVLTSPERAERAAPTGAAQVLVAGLESLESGVPPPGVPGGPADPAYVMYTSGSTGQPKGVVVEHRHVARVVDWAARTYSAEEVRGTLASTSVCFDVSVVELWTPLVTGGALIMAGDLLALPELATRDRVTMLFGVPSALAALVRFGLPPGVRTVTSAGEPLPRALADRLYAQPGVARVRNCYGPTETTVYCTAQEVARDDRAEPGIGVPIAGARLSIRDPATGQPTEPGELWVAGPGVARGYLNRPELTGQAFVEPGDGERWYRTGDLVRRDGVGYHFLGRLDDQVKVRGHRVELGEVRAALAAHPGVHHAVVLAPADAEGTRRLVGYVEPASIPPTEADLRGWLRDRLPGHLLPSRIVVLDRIPLGPTGKVDRGALPAPPPDRDPDPPYRPPRNPVESKVAEVVADALGLPEVGAHDRLGDLGGHSLTAARIVARLAEELRVPVPLGWYLAEPTVAGLASRIAAADSAAVSTAGTSPGPAPHPGRRVYPLTDMQQEFWLGRRLYPESCTTIAVRLRLTGVTDTGRVRAALDGLVRRHEVLRTGFEAWEDGPGAVVHPPAPVPLTEHTTPAGDAAAAATARHVFDLAGGEPLLRAALIHTGPEAADLVVAVDHLAFDGYSTGILMAELAESLAGNPPDGPAVQVGDVALYEQALAEDRSRTGALAAFWRDALAGAAAPGELAGRRPDRRAARGARIVRPLEPDLVRAVDGFARQACGGSRFAPYAAALGVVLHRLTGEPTPVVGTASALRDRPGLPRVIGPLIRVLPVPVPATGDPAFRELAARVTAVTSQALAHQDLTAGELARCAGFDRPRGAGLCPVLLTMQPADLPVVTRAGPVRVELLGELETGMAATDLACFVNQTATGTEIQVEYDVGLYHRSDVQTLLELLLRVLRAAVAEPDRPVSTLELLDPGQQRALRELGRGPDQPEPRPATVVDAIDEQVRARPAAVAVVGPDGELSYAQLAEVSARIAGALAAVGVSPGDPVGVCVPRDRLLPAALLGVARCGAAYVPLDPEYPADRLAWLAADGQVRTVVSRGGARPAAHAIPGVTVVDLDRLPAGGPVTAAPSPGDLAYVLYTSGSTGRPKGVEVSHANLADHTTALRTVLGLDPADAVLALAPLTFDAVGIEIWSPLAAGARCVVVERDQVVDGRMLAKRIAEGEPTVAFLPPTLLRILLAVEWPGDPRLRVWAGGEAMDPALARAVLPRVAQLWNVYGPTETTTLSAVHPVVDPPATGPVPIGRPLPGEWVYVLDPHGRLAPRGMVGELWIGGTGVGLGYRNRPDLTEAAFRPDPHVPGARCYRTGDLVRWDAGGRLEFLGRADHQVKIRGQRLELGEIEAVLHEHPDVAQAVVTVHGDGPDAVLVGYLVPERLDPAAVAEFLRGRLPEFMVPRRWVTLPAMPTTASGKADRRALPEPGPPAAAGAAPLASELERFVAEVWTEVLGGTGVGRASDFFALGGNSFAATLVAARLRATLGCDVPVGLLFDRPVLADFAADVEGLALAQLARDPE